MYVGAQLQLQTAGLRPVLCWRATSNFGLQGRDRHIVGTQLQLQTAGLRPVLCWRPIYCWSYPVTTLWCSTGRPKKTTVQYCYNSVVHLDI